MPVISPAAATVTTEENATMPAATVTDAAAAAVAVLERLSALADKLDAKLAGSLDPSVALDAKLSVEYMDKLTRRAVRGAAQSVWLERHGESLASACANAGSPALRRYAATLRAAMVKAGV